MQMSHLDYHAELEALIESKSARLSYKEANCWVFPVQNKEQAVYLRNKISQILKLIGDIAVQKVTCSIVINSYKQVLNKGTRARVQNTKNLFVGLRVLNFFCEGAFVNINMYIVLKSSQCKYAIC